MGRKDFHKEPFDEGTLNKLALFEKYAGAWIPVFVSQPQPPVSELHIFDFFAGPGRDVKGQPGSPLRLLKQLSEYSRLAGWPRVSVHAHFFDKDPAKVQALRETVEAEVLAPAGCHLDFRALGFTDAIQDVEPILRRPNAAKLVLIDQTGTDAVLEGLFVEMTSWPRCDFQFFLASSAFHRFPNHPALKLGVTSSGDHREIHRRAANHYRALIPETRQYFVAPFSFMKGSNVYGVIFGSRHPLGMDKFLRVAWDLDPVNGEADFDIGGEGIRQGQGDLFERTTRKVAAFEADLTAQIATGAIRNERDVLRLCFEHGVLGKHAESVLKDLRTEERIALDFRVPDVKRWTKPKQIRLKGAVDQ